MCAAETFESVVYNSAVPDDEDYYGLYYSILNQVEPQVRDYEVCYLKALLDASLGDNVCVAAYSFVADSQVAAVPNGFLYGYRQDSLGDTRAICVEVKRPTREGQNNMADTDISRATIVVNTTSSSATVASLSAQISADVANILSNIGDESLSMYIQPSSENYGSDWGIYCATHSDLDTAKLHSSRACQLSQDNYDGITVPTNTDPSHAAVTFQ